MLSLFDNMVNNCQQITTIDMITVMEGKLTKTTPSMSIKVILHIYKKQDQISIDAVEGKTHRTQMTDNMIFHSCI